MNEKDLKRANRESIASRSSNPAINGLDSSGNPQFPSQAQDLPTTPQDLPATPAKSRVSPSEVAGEVQDVSSKLK